MRSLVIDRTKWYRGKGDTHSRLLRADDGMMCCLGFYSLACGLSREDIEDISFPTSVDWSLPGEMDWLCGEPGDDCDYTVEVRVGNVNDSTAITDVEREQRLTALFAEHGVNVTFVN
jgi:hypothetical protein